MAASSCGEPVQGRHIPWPCFKKQPSGIATGDTTPSEIDTAKVQSVMGVVKVTR
jgi:hypothetical protein